MKLPIALLIAASLAPTPSLAAERHPVRKATHPPKAEAASKSDTADRAKEYFHPSETRSTGTVTVGGQPITYDAVAGTLVVHAKDRKSVPALINLLGELPQGSGWRVEEVLIRLAGEQAPPVSLPRWKRLKIRSHSSGATPGPASAISSVARSPW